MTNFEFPDRKRDEIAPDERAMIDAHIAQFGVTKCKPYAFSENRKTMSVQARNAMDRNRARGDSTRRMVFAAHEAGLDSREIGRKFGISHEHVGNILRGR